MRLFSTVMGWLIAILGGFFVVAGGQLAILGGSPYYLAAGIAMVVSGAMIGRRDPRGRMLFLAVWIGTVIWAVWEVGFEPLWLVPRVVAPTVLLVLVYLPAMVGAARRPRIGRAVAAVAVAAIAVTGMKLVTTPDVARAQSVAAPAGPAGTGDWSSYGGTLAGDRYSTLAQITPANVSRLEQVWVQRTGDLPMFGSHLGVPIKTGVPNLGSSIITRGGVVFIAATTDQYLRAFDVKTGVELWKARLPAGAQATPMTYRGRDGRQYVVITAGGHGALGTRYGDYTIAFALPRSSG